jgi:hypothetical protein
LADGVDGKDGSEEEQGGEKGKERAEEVPGIKEGLSGAGCCRLVALPEEGEGEKEA